MTGLVARSGDSAWTAAPDTGARDTAAPDNGTPGAGPAAGWPGDGGVSYLGWMLVVVTADSTAPPGQVMVLDGARPVDAGDFRGGSGRWGRFGAL